MENFQEEQEEQDEKVETIVLRPSPDNKDVIQSYILTTARYDFSVYEKRILYRIVEGFQYQLEGKKLDKDFSISKDLDGDVKIKLPISSLLINKKDEHYNRIKKAIKALENKRFIYEDSKVWEIIRLIITPKIDKYNRHVQFRLHHKIYQALLNFSKGYRKLELRTVMTFKSVYAMRFYELLSGQTKPLTYSVENLKEMFQLKTKYKPIRTFIKYVIEPAKRELNKKSPYSFTYELQYEKKRNQRGRKKITEITFTPIYHSEHRDKLLEYNDKHRDFDLLEVLTDEEIQAFLSMGFTKQELKDKYYDLLQDIEKAKKQGEIFFTDIMIEYAQKKENKKSYIVRALRNEIKKWKEGLLEKKPTKLSEIEKKGVIEYRKEKESIYNFLKNIVEIPISELEKGTEFVLEQGGSSYLTHLLLSCKSDTKLIQKKFKEDYLSAR